MLAEKIKQYRMAAGLTQKEMAQSINASQNTISQYESGKRTPTVKKLIAITMLLGCSVDELTGKPPTVTGTATLDDSVKA